MEIVNCSTTGQVRQGLNLRGYVKHLIRDGQAGIPIEVIFSDCAGRAVSPLECASPELSVPGFIRIYTCIRIKVDDRYSELIQAADSILMKSSAGGCIGARASPAAG